MSSTSSTGPHRPATAEARSGPTARRPQTPARRNALLPPGSPTGPSVDEVEGAEEGQPADLRQPLRGRLHELGPAARGHGHDAGGPLRPVPVAQHGHAGAQQLGVGGRVGPQDRAQTLSPAEVGEPGQRPPRKHGLGGRDLALQRHAQAVHAAGPLRARVELDAGPLETTSGGGDRGLGDVRGEPGAHTGVAAAALGGAGVVERVLEERHPAAAGALVVEHEPLLALAGLAHPRVALGVVGPRRPGGGPAARDALHGPVDVEHLQQELEPGAPDVDDRLQRHRRQRPGGLRQGGDHGIGLLLARHRRGGEVGPDLAVLRPGQQQHVGALGRAAGTADLLVVGDRGGGGAEVQHEAEVGLVEAHAEGAGRDEGLDLVVAQRRLEPLAVGGVGAAGVGLHRVPGLPQGCGDVLGRRHREAVDDAAAGEVVEVREQPGQPLLGRGLPQHAEAQGLAGQPAAQGQHVVAACAQLLDDVGHDRALAVAVVASTGVRSGRVVSRSRIRR